MNCAGVDADRASAVFETFQVYSPDGMRYLPQFFIPQAVREMGYCPTVQLLHDTLNRVVPVGECMTLPFFLNLCEAMESTRHLSAATVKELTQAFDVRGNGMVRRSEFRTILTTASADLSAGEIEAVLELLDPLHTDTIQLRALRTIMERFASGDTGFISPSSYTRRNHQQNDRHLQPYPLNMDSRGRKSDYAAQDRMQLGRKVPTSKVASAPGDDTISISQPSVESAALASSRNSGVVTRATSLKPPRLSTEKGGSGRQEDTRASLVLDPNIREPLPGATVLSSLRVERLNSTTDERSASRDSPLAQIPSNVLPQVNKRNENILSEVPLEQLRDVRGFSAKRVVDARKEREEFAFPTTPKEKITWKKKKIFEKCCTMI